MLVPSSHKVKGRLKKTFCAFVVELWRCCNVALMAHLKQENETKLFILYARVLNRLPVHTLSPGGRSLLATTCSAFLTKIKGLHSVGIP